MHADVTGPVLILDTNQSFSMNLGRSFQQLDVNVWLSDDLEQARATCETFPPRIIVTELRVQGRWAFDFIDELREVCPSARVVIATVYPSVATAVKACKLGFDAYFAHPVTARMILDVVGSACAQQPQVPDGANWPSLDRTIWEYLNQAFVAAGTMSEAARRLGLDRRSLRRMLAKYPPAR